MVKYAGLADIKLGKLVKRFCGEPLKVPVYLVVAENNGENKDLISFKLPSGLLVDKFKLLVRYL